MNARNDLTETPLPAGPTGLPWRQLLPGRSIRRRHGPKSRPWIALSILASLLLTLGSSVVAQELGGNVPLEGGPDEEVQAVEQAVTDVVGEATGQGGSGSGSGSGSSEGSGGGGGGQGSSNTSSSSDGSGEASARSAGKAASAKVKRTRDRADGDPGTQLFRTGVPPAQPGVLQTNDPCLSKADTRSEDPVDRSIAASPDVRTAGFAQQIESRVRSSGDLGISVRKTNDADGDGCFSEDELAPRAGDDVEFRIAVRNTGTAPVRIEQVLDSFRMLTIDVCERLVGTTLEAGASATCYFTLKAYTPPEFDSVANLVEVIASRPSGQGGAVTATDTSTVVTFPRLITLGIG